MTNMQCYSYAVVAVDNLMKAKAKITTDNLYYELYHLWDMYTEEGIEKIARYREENREIL